MHRAQTAEPSTHMECHNSKPDMEGASFSSSCKSILGPTVSIHEKKSDAQHSQQVDSKYQVIEPVHNLFWIGIKFILKRPVGTFDYSFRIQPVYMFKPFGIRQFEFFNNFPRKTGTILIKKLYNLFFGVFTHNYDSFSHTVSSLPQRGFLFHNLKTAGSCTSLWIPCYKIHFEQGIQVFLICCFYFGILSIGWRTCILFPNS